MVWDMQPQKLLRKKIKKINMLLTEYRPFKVNKQLVEASIKENKSLVVKGVIQRAEAKNQNGRIYPKEILMRGEVEILSTPAGNILKELFRNGITVGISSRGMGSVQESGNGTVEVQDDFELLCFDFVSTPSTHGAWMKPAGRAITELQEGKIQLPEYKYTNVNNIIRDIICDNTGTCAC
jgi:hypothetical protein